VLYDKCAIPPHNVRAPAVWIMNGRPELNLVASLGCLSLLAVVCLLCMMPLLLV